MPASRVLLAGLFHETNTFAPGRLHVEDFEVQLGKEILDLKGDGSVMGAVLEESPRFGWEPLPTINFRATPGCMPAPEVMQFFFNEFEKRSRHIGPVDAVFLVLHGAMATEALDDPEGEFLRRIRANPQLRDIPVFGVLDLHANVTPEMARHANALISYRENPHTDSAETGRRAAGLLEDCLRKGIVPRSHFIGTNIVLPPTGTGTADSPMRELQLLARELEEDGFLSVSVNAGFAQADTPYTGLSFLIVYDPNHASAALLDSASQRLVASAEKLKHLGIVSEWNLSSAIDDALAKGQFPCCLVEPADNIGGGAPGDGTEVLRALIDRRLAGSVAVIFDPESASRAEAAGVGATVRLSVGGKIWPQDPGPVELEAEVLGLSDGRFTLEDPHSHMASMRGLHIQMGTTALIENSGVKILLTSKRTAPMDLGQWRSQGVDPATMKFIGIKAAIAHRRAYDRIAKASYTVRTTGPCTSDLASLPYRKIRRPVFPLDPI